MTAIELRGVEKAYGKRRCSPRLDLAVERGTFLVVLGPPACGKSVLVRLLTGLEAPSAGSISLRGQDAAGRARPSATSATCRSRSPSTRTTTSTTNIAYPLSLMGMARSEIEPKVQKVAALLKIAHLLGKRPNQLSGGEKQRVALARGIVKPTDIFLLDDPLTGLDFKLREQLFDDLKQMQQDLDATFVYMTSDPLEALALADRIAILDGGRLLSTGPVEEVYRRPNHLRAMELLGVPPANRLDGVLRVQGGQVLCDAGLFRFAGRGPVAGSCAVDGRPVQVAIRPQHLAPAAGRRRAAALPGGAGAGGGPGRRAGGVPAVGSDAAGDAGPARRADRGRSRRRLRSASARPTRWCSRPTAACGWARGARRMSEIRLQDLRKEFKETVAVRDVTLTFPSSAVTCLLGPSGCGKTTMMRIIAGLEQPTSGDVYFDQERVTRVVTRRRRIGMVFQYPVVYSGVTVRQNIELPLLHERVSPEERRKRVEEVVEILRLGDVVDVNVDRLDMAARQKVAVAREIARQPRFILFDEPITNVDVETKIQIRRALKVLTRQRRQTMIYVTHDQTDAMTLADRIVLMKEGRIVQCDAPRTLYDSPAEVFGGWFLGNPGMNFLEHRLDRSGATARLVSPLLPRPVRLKGAVEGNTVVVGLRPEHAEVRLEPSPRAVRGRVLRQVLTVGGQLLLTVQLGDCVLKVKAPPGMEVRAGAEVLLECPLRWIRVFGADDRRLEVELEDEVAA